MKPIEITIPRVATRAILAAMEPFIVCEDLYGTGIALAVLGIGVLIAGHTPMTRALVQVYANAGALTLDAGRA